MVVSRAKGLLLTDSRDGAASRRSDGVDRQVSVRAAGVTLGIAAHRFSAVYAARIAEQCFDVLSRRVGLGITVFLPQQARLARRHLTAICDRLNEVATDAGAEAAGIELAVTGETLRPQEIWAIRRHYLGDGTLHLLPDVQPNDEPGHALQRRFWNEAWRLRDCRQVSISSAFRVSSSCELLSPELAVSVLPAEGLQVPTGTAWVSAEINLAAFADADGVLPMAALLVHARRCIDEMDAAHEEAGWSTASMRHDAWLNRRLALNVTGLGELVRRRGSSPAGFETLRELDRVLAALQTCLRQYSRELALRTDRLPALKSSDPGQSLPEGELRNAWSGRWLEAVERLQTRHRNLLVLSPWSLFPNDVDADYRYADLLPLLARADACAHGSRPSLRHWQADQYYRFHRRCHAVLTEA